jgi:excisionase family DNA binding protein
MSKHPEPAHEPQLLATVQQACRAISCGRTKLYELINERKLRVVKIGRASRVPWADLHRLANDVSRPNHHTLGVGAADSARAREPRR